MTKVDFISTVPRYLLEGIAIIALIFLLFIQKKIHGDIQIIIPTIAALVVSLQRVLPAIQQLYASLTKLKSNEASLKRVLFYLELKITSKPSFLIEKQLNFKNEIKLSNIFFNYNQYSSYVLSNLSLTVEKGSKIGIVGESGSGKSTLIDIFMGLLHPVNGFIMIDDVQLNNDNLNQWMSKISNVPQTIFLADSTIAENIAFGLPKDKIDMDLVKLVSERAHISNTIESWENKYDTLVGERGTKLSGGQKQRIGIARALYRKTEVLVLDEATSALDENTENSVMNEIDKFSSEITILIIAHRISTLKGCDKIFEILNGNVLVYNSYTDYVNIKKL
jgi:ATP-binding cassette subfamily B protein